MGHFFSITAWLATIAGLIFSVITSIPQVWDKTSITSWIWTSSGWIVALVFCILLSINRSNSDKKMNEINDKYRDLRVAHSNLIAKAKELRSRLQEVVAEKKAAYRANAYLMDRLEQAEPKQPIKRKTKD